MSQNIYKQRKCNFINTEINHDLGPGSKSRGQPGPVKVNEIHKKPIFIDSSRTDTPCHPPPPPEDWANWFKNDPQSFELIVGKKIGGDDKDPEITGVGPNILYNNENKPDVTGKLKGQWFANTEVGTKKINVRKYHQNHANFTDFRDKNLFHMFGDCTPDEGGEVDVFFVIDTGDKLGHLLGKNPVDPPSLAQAPSLEFTKYNINVIHSPVTLGDSAPKNKPHSPVYDKIFKQFDKLNDKPGRVSCRLLSWLVTKNIIIDDLRHGGDIPKEDFMTNHKIAANYLPGAPYTYQTWADNTNKKIYNTMNPKEENNKTTVQEWLRTEAHLDIIEGDPQNALNLLGIVDKNQISLNVQKKRSGDHLQLLFAKYLYKFKNDLEFIKPDDLLPDMKPKSDYFASRDNTFFKKNTFFITGDWPACAFAIFNNINTVMFYKQQDKTKTCFLVFTFN